MAGRKGRGHVLNRAEMADHLGIALTTLDDWVRRGCPVLERGSRGRQWSFNSADVHRWHEQRVRAEALDRTVATDAELRSRALLADTEMRELDLAKAKGEVVPIQQYERALSLAFAEARANLRTVVPTRIARRIRGEPDETRIKAVILEEMDHALEALAEAELLDEDAIALDEAKA